MKRQRPTMTDVQGMIARNPGLRALNPHIESPGMAIPASPAASPAVSRPISDHPTAKTGAGGKIRLAPAPRTNPEKQMALILEDRKRKGGILDWIFEGITLQFGGVRYTPDFVIFWPEGRCSFTETKGAHIWEDSKIKFALFKARFPQFEFSMMQLRSGSWNQIA